MRLLVSLLLITSVLFSCQNNNSGNEKLSAKVNYLDSLDLHFHNFAKDGVLPGFTVSIFNKDKILFQKGYGYADLAEKKPFTPETVQMVGSVSKTLIAVALMKLVEQGKLSLDDDINDLLPFEVVHPHFPDENITVRQLATHTSGIQDGPNYARTYVFKKQLNPEAFPPAWAEYITIYNKNKWRSMEDFLKAILVQGREWYTEENFSKQRPGANYEYSNVSATLLAYIIEILSGKEYGEFTQELILGPIRMKNSGWSLEEIDTVNHVTYYNEEYNPVPKYGVITYPDGGLFTSTVDLTRYLQEMMKGYYGESKLLKPSSFKEMMKNQIDTLDTPTGIIWDMDNSCCIGHGGNDFGVATMMFFNPENGLGKILFSNISLEKEVLAERYYTIFDRLFKYDTELVKLKE